MAVLLCCFQLKQLPANRFFCIFSLFRCGYQQEYQRIQCFIVQSTVATLIRQGGLLLYQQLPTKNCKLAFKSLKVIIQNIVSFFAVDTALYSTVCILTKWILRATSAKILKIYLNLPKIHTDKIYNI